MQYVDNSNNANNNYVEFNQREMAIDCPDGFIPEVKTKPCLPNLISNQLKCSSLSNSNCSKSASNSIDKKQIKVLKNNNQNHKLSLSSNESVKSKSNKIKTEKSESSNLFESSIQFTDEDFKLRSNTLTMTVNAHLLSSSNDETYNINLSSSSNSYHHHFNQHHHDKKVKYTTGEINSGFELSDEERVNSTVTTSTNLTDTSSNQNITNNLLSKKQQQLQKQLLKQFTNDSTSSETKISSPLSFMSNETSQSSLLKSESSKLQSMSETSVILDRVNESYDVDESKEIIKIETTKFGNDECNKQTKTVLREEFNSLITNNKLNLNQSDYENLLKACNNDLNLLNQILNSNDFLNKFNMCKNLTNNNSSSNNITYNNNVDIFNEHTKLNEAESLRDRSNQAHNIYENDMIFKQVDSYFKDNYFSNNNNSNHNLSSKINRELSFKKIEKTFQDKINDDFNLNNNNNNSNFNNRSDSLKKDPFDNRLLYEDLIIAKDEKFENEEGLSDEGKYLLKKAQYYCVDNLKLVNIEKPNDPLGATIKNRDGSIVISRIVMGGAAQKSGLLHEGDEILEINMIAVRGKTINDVCDMLCNLQGMISFLIIPNMSYENVSKISIDEKCLTLPNLVHIRALFNYSPQEDLYIPCKELGLSFSKGDILHVTSQEDEDWWQAYKDDDKDQSMAGLIPSQSFQERRFSQMHSLIGDSFMSRKKRQKGFCAKGVHISRRRKMLYGIDATNLEEIVTYEEVTLFKPSNFKRPIVLIGPHNIGRHELRKRLMQLNPSLFEVAVPHTTRQQRRDEVDGKDYHFLPRHIFEVDIKQGRFIEHGEYEKNLYGTSREAIKKVIENGKICVLNLYPQALKNLRCSDLMPYVIYIGPPNLIKLKELKSIQNETFKESDLLDIIDRGREIEEMYGHYFDKIIRNTNMDKTYQELYDTIFKVQNEENWVPTSWLMK